MTERNYERERVKLHCGANYKLTMNWPGLSQSQWRYFLSRIIDIEGEHIKDRIIYFVCALARSMVFGYPDQTLSLVFDILLQILKTGRCS